MDPKVIEMNNLRVLNDYLNQTLDVLVRGRSGHTPGLGYSPFAGTIPSAPAMGTDVVYGPSPFGFAGAPLFGGVSHAAFAPTSPFTGLPMIGAGFGTYGAWSQPWGQQPWGQQPWGQQSWGQSPWTAGQWTPGQAWPAAEAARQAQVTQTLAAKQSVLEAICRCCGIPV
jgi:hypothetical protein